ncbi:hypothetical protein AAZX31_20G060300 [Glycine max]|uniref:Uncharacterized protein n=1 Tax=Glycine max TaxID=3847 RepID=K7N1Y8_SOYBN|nr:uncharacterized protein LOC100793762 [Glycine max]KAG4906940.1 hypothetical protein JHK86_055424 [Glycine max]KAG4918156.1 hypothetical protein JHK85_056437 [Glycine max]KAG5074233.1 hypothetical protein JHK84_055464 [Glycine max]KAH1034907.1 hypothetical protein GYH30_055050 [Glycine max]KAH1189782.1 hypothetical protein GmHk_20G057493 [Glycine max]|eukprot:XP_003555689.1 uncharacterized protein LOC100793762 [Glycine max]
MCWSSHSLLELELELELDGVVNVVKHKQQHNMRLKRNKLEDIPEETELPPIGIDTNPAELEEAGLHLETDLEILRRAMDMGLWALCLGFGYMLSRAHFRPLS